MCVYVCTIVCVLLIVCVSLCMYVLLCVCVCMYHCVYVCASLSLVVCVLLSVCVSLCASSLSVCPLCVCFSLCVSLSLLLLLFRHCRIWASPLLLKLLLTKKKSIFRYSLHLCDAQYFCTYHVQPHHVVAELCACDDVFYDVAAIIVLYFVCLYCLLGLSVE